MLQMLTVVAFYILMAVLVVLYGASDFGMLLEYLMYGFATLVL